eukprot:3231184-Prymnesium_polylepis.1
MAAARRALDVALKPTAHVRRVAAVAAALAPRVQPKDGQLADGARRLALRSLRARGARGSR